MIGLYIRTNSTTEKISSIINNSAAE